MIRVVDNLFRRLAVSLLIGVCFYSSALADVEADCKKVGTAAAWTIFAGFGHDVTPEIVIETTPNHDGVDLFKDLIWDEEKIHDMIRQIIESKFEIDRSREGLRKAQFFGEFFRLECVAEAERQVQFQRLPDVKSEVQKCIDTSSQSRFSYELCILDKAIDKESWKDHTGPIEEDFST